MTIDGSSIENIENRDAKREGIIGEIDTLKGYGIIHSGDNEYFFYSTACIGGAEVFSEFQIGTLVTFDVMSIYKNPSMTKINLGYGTGARIANIAIKDDVGQISQDTKDTLAEIMAGHIPEKSIPPMHVI